MGRLDKPHTRMEIRCDAGIYERMEKYLEKENKDRKRKITKTEFVEQALDLYLSYLENEN